MEQIWTPYTYLLTHIPTGLKYYGVRYAQGCHPSEFWKKYKTSSKAVADLILEYGDESFVFEIRRTFFDAQPARLWETKVLKRLKVTQRDDYLNKTDNIAIAPQPGNNNPAKRKEVREKIRAARMQWLQNNPNPNIGRKTLKHVKQKQSERKLGQNNPFYGKAHTQENKELFSTRQLGENNSFYGKQHTQHTKDAMSRTRTGKSKPKVTCPHCNKEGAPHVMVRWHFNNCKGLL